METNQFEGYFIKFQYLMGSYPIQVHVKTSYSETTFSGKTRVKYFDSLVKSFKSVEEAEDFIAKQLALKEECDKRATLYRVK